MRTRTPVRPLTLALALRLLSGGDATSAEPPPREVNIRAQAIRAHVEFLADDLLEGRATASRGHRLAAKYLQAQCAAAGWRGAGEGGAYCQKVPLVRTVVDERRTSLAFEFAGGATNLVYARDFVIVDTHREREGSVAGELVFAGYGVTAPGQDYDDYGQVNANGKIVVLLAAEAPATFPADLRAYYSDHDVKRANAAAHGAIGVLYLDSPKMEERFPWDFTLRELRIGWNSMRWLGPNGTVGGLRDPIRVFGKLSRRGAEALFAGERQGLNEVFAAAEKGAPPRFALAKRAAARFFSRHEKIESDNVVAVLEGADASLAREYVVFSAHLDHLGIGDAIDGDSIYNGAMDNASGCAVLLEAARSLATPRPRRSLLLLFTTGEEAGLLGSDYFAQHPVVPPGSIVANINIDGAAVLTPTTDVIAWGAEHSSLRTPVEAAARAVGLTVSPDPFPEEGIFVRSDQFSFVKRGVPSLYVDVGFTSAEPGVDGLEVVKKWLTTVYHSPKDDAAQPIRYETSARFADFVLHLGRAVANADSRPRWNPRDFFGETFGKPAP